MDQAARFQGPQGPEPEEEILRGKYLDYCSARMAEVLLRLSADEMYVLAEAAARASGFEDPSELTYDNMVRLATVELSRQAALPPFDTWVIAYGEDPERFERELLGLWTSGPGRTPPSDGPLGDAARGTAAEGSDPVGE